MFIGNVVVIGISMDKDCSNWLGLFFFLDLVGSFIFRGYW